METKADAGKYEHLEEFKADAQTIVHNVVIFHGGKSFYNLRATGLLGISFYMCVYIIRVSV